MNDVTLQINLSPLDYPRVIHLLPHQLKQLAGQCNEILIVLDLKKSTGKKSSGSNWETNKEPIIAYLNELKDNFYPNLRIEEVDYSHKIRKEMSKTIMKRGSIPDKDFSGGPFYSYYFGIFISKYNNVLHIDADMMFGGGSQNWVAEALNVLESDSSIFSCSPLTGPPPLDENIMPANYRNKFNPIAKYKYPFSYLYYHFSTRVFLLKKERLYKNVSVQRPNFDHYIKAILRGASPYRYPEGTISDMIKEKRWYRLDFYGSAPGLWSLHPCTNPEMRLLVSSFIHLIEHDVFPESQRCYHDANTDFLEMARNVDKSLRPSN